MKIKKIETICVHLPFDHGAPKVKFHGQDWNNLEFVLIKIEMDNGIIGWGEAFGYVSWKSVKIAINEMVAPAVIGKIINNIEDIQNLSYEIQKTLHIFGRYGITLFAISGIDIALWDALGKEKGLPISELIGKPKKKEFNAYASLFRYSDKKLVEKKCQESLDRGFKIIKLHEIKNDTIECARNYIGKKIPLMTDVNCAWTYDEIVEKKDFLEKINLYWLEEPIFPPEDYQKLSELQKNCNISIAAGENSSTFFDFKKMIDAKAVSFSQPSVIKVGGISEMIKVINYSEKNKVPVMPHTAYFGPGFLASLHLASHTSLDTLIERFWLDLEEEFYPEFQLAKDGKYFLPKGPGLGLNFNEKKILKYKVN